MLPGKSAPEGAFDPRWQAIIAVGEFTKEEPEAVWRFIEKWGVSPDDDLRSAVATCLLEHLLEHHFARFIDRVENAAVAHPLFADTVLQCWNIGESELTANAERLDRLKARISPLVD